MYDENRAAFAPKSKADKSFSVTCRLWYLCSFAFEVRGRQIAELSVRKFRI